MSFTSCSRTLRSGVRLRRVLSGRSYEGCDRPPDGITRLCLEGHHMPNGLWVVPSSVRVMLLAGSFSQPLRNLLLPEKLRVLGFNRSFDQPIDDLVLPPGLIALNTGPYFNQPLDRVVFPKFLKALCLGSRFHRAFSGVTLPDSLESLAFRGLYKPNLGKVLLPPKIKRLTIQPLINIDLRNWHLPLSLVRVSLRLGRLGRVPSLNGLKNLRYLSLGISKEDQLHHVCFPEKLGVLALAIRCDYDCRNLVLPSRLKVLDIQYPMSAGHLHGSPKGWKLPETLKILRINRGFEEPVIGWELPPGLLCLSLWDTFQDPIINWSLPTSLRTLYLGTTYSNSLKGWVPPPNLRLLNAGYGEDLPILPKTVRGLILALDATIPDGWVIDNPSPYQRPSRMYLTRSE